jgi:ATP-dependent DNA ligase
VVLFAPSPMLAQLQKRLPIGDQWRYEPKLDGFRGLLWRRGDNGVQLLSRNLKDLTSCFPELASAGQSLPPNTLVDGEIIIVNAEGSSDFGALQRRLAVAWRDARVAGNECPAVLLCFDLLIQDGVDLTTRPLLERRSQLESLLGGLHPCLQLVTQTEDASLAQEWLALVPSIEGVVAKRADGRYVPGRREWIKVKRQNSVDCVVIGLAGDPAAPSLVLGLRHSDGDLHHLGRIDFVICHFQWVRPLRLRSARVSSAAARAEAQLARMETDPRLAAQVEFRVQAGW